MSENDLAAPENILVVEEHPALRKALREWLAVSFPDYRVTTSLTYIEAVDRIKEDSPLLVLLDFNMSGFKVQQAIQRIKSIAPSSKIVILTLFEDDSYRSIFESAGANAHVSKKSLGTNLITTMNALLDGSYQQEI